MKVDTLPIGLYQENSYVLHDHDHVLLIDPGRYAELIEKQISEEETVDAVVLTHGHEDHTGAVDDVCDKYHCPVYIHPLDRNLVDPQTSEKGGYYEQPVYHALSDLKEGMCRIGSFDLDILHTPGHTAGSVIIRYRNVLFTGDTLFAGDIGRTDLAGGSEEEMMASLARIARLPRDLKVYPGHGAPSTISQELSVNPYLVYITRHTS